MKKILIFILATINLYAVKDYIIKKHFFNNKIIYKINTDNYPEKLNSKIKSDKYNIFLYSKHFRIIFGKDYNNSQIRNLSNTLLQIAEHVYKKEIEELKFKAPKNSSKYYIDIYIANTNAYNEDSGKNIVISNEYCGYATYYSNKTPYFIINPHMNIDLYKVTIAHEFFHTIQFSYFDFMQLDDKTWEKDLWFLEATATMMEDEVYDNINDYINYLYYYFPYTYKSLDYYNGGIEYGKVLFAKFLKKEYGINIIKSIFENYHLNETILDRIKKEVKYYGDDFNNTLLKYYYDLINKNFKDAKFFPEIKQYSLKKSHVKVEKYGALFYNKGTKYFVSSNPMYLQETYQKETNMIEDINYSGLIFISLTNIESNITIQNIFKNINIHAGWNLLTNYTNTKISFNDFFSKAKIIWVYRNNKFFAYSNIKKIKKLIIKKGFYFNGIINPTENFWLYSDKNFTVYFPLSLHTFSYKLKKGWNFINPTSSTIKPYVLNAKYILRYENKTWKCYGLKCNKYKKILYIKPEQGYWIYK